MLKKKKKKEEKNDLSKAIYSILKFSDPYNCMTDM